MDGGADGGAGDSRVTCGAPSSVMLPRPSAHSLAVQARGYVSSVFQGYGDKLQTKEVAVCSLTNVVSLINSVSVSLLTGRPHGRPEAQQFIVLLVVAVVE